MSEIIQGDCIQKMAEMRRKSKVRQVYPDIIKKLKPEEGGSE